MNDIGSPVKLTMIGPGLSEYVGNVRDSPVATALWVDAAGFRTTITYDEAKDAGSLFELPPAACQIL